MQRTAADLGPGFSRGRWGRKVHPWQGRDPKGVLGVDGEFHILVAFARFQVWASTVPQPAYIRVPIQVHIATFGVIPGSDPLRCLVT
jgi:hypothetical protein